MSVIKQINVYNGSAWLTGLIGADAGNITLSSNIAGSSNLQTALSNVLPVTSLSASRVVLTDTNGKLSTSDGVSSTLLGYLNGLTGPIQTQINTLNTNLSRVSPRKGTLSDGTDLNTLYGPENCGQYILSGSYTYSNLPTGVIWGVLEVEGGIFTIQRFVGSSGVTFVRMYANETWSSWSRLTSDTYVADRYVSNTGDTMTGALTIKSSNLKHGTVPSSETYGTRLYYTGSDDEVFGQLRAVSYPSGMDGMQLVTYRDVNGSYVYNIFTMGLMDNGSKFVSFTDPTSWRTALGIQNTIQSAQSSSTKSLSAGTWKGLNSLTLTPGVYIITAGCVIPSSVTSGTTAIHVGTANNSDSTLNRAAQLNIPANAGSATTNLSVATVYSCTSNTTIYLNAYCATACTLAANGSGLYAYKIIPN